jgi:hypothetical protein
MAPQRTEEWKRALEKGFGSKRRMTFVLGDEPEDLIEDVAARIITDFELEAEEDEGNTNEESNMDMD